MDSLQEQVSDLQRRLLQAERELAAWRNLIVAPESGGGSIAFGADAVILRINALTPESGQMP